MKIGGGYYIKARCIMQSEIMRSPPYVREVWDWLLMNANHKDRGSVKRGQLFTCLDAIREGLAWYIGYRKVTYTKDSMKKAMKALKKASMITTSVSTNGMLITICNYDNYQNPKNYESTNESTNESTIKAPSKHHESPPTQEGNELEEGKNEESILSDFEEFWLAYPAMNGGDKGTKKPAKEKYIAIIKKGKADHERIMEGIGKYIGFLIGKPTRESANASTWLNQERWDNDYTTTMPAITHSVQPEWRSEGDRLAAKYREEAERERESYIVAEYQ